MSKPGGIGIEVLLKGLRGKKGKGLSSVQQDIAIFASKMGDEYKRLLDDPKFHNEDHIDEIFCNMIAFLIGSHVRTLKRAGSELDMEMMLSIVFYNILRIATEYLNFVESKEDVE